MIALAIHPPGRDAGPRAMRSGAAPWGDGFADDDWRDLARVTRWEALHPDEYVRLFPRLVPTDGRVPPCLLAHLVEALAARAWRLGRTDKSTAAAVPRLRALTADQVAALGRMADRRVFASPILSERRSGTVFRVKADPAEAARTLAEALLLDEVLCRLRDGSEAIADTAAAADVAFVAGLHPAYLWPAAGAAADRHATAAWLGLVARGRPALMPADVADTILDLVVCQGERPVAVRDEQVARFIALGVGLEVLWAAARRRRRGATTVVTRRLPLRTRLVGLVAERRERWSRRDALGGTPACEREA